MKTVLIIDPDLGFVFWLGWVLGDAGWQALPAKGFSEATDLLSQLHMEIDLLVVNPFLTGATDFVDTSRCSQPNLKVLVVLEKERQVGPIQNADTIVRKLLRVDRVAGALWHWLGREETHGAPRRHPVHELTRRL